MGRSLNTFKRIRNSKKNEKITHDDLGDLYTETKASEFDYEDYKTNLKTCPNCGSKKINIDAPWSTAESYKCRDCGNTWSTMNAFDDPTGTAFEDWDEAGYQAKYGGRKLDSHGQPNNDFEPQAGNCGNCGHPYDNHSTVDSICYGGGDGKLGEGPLGGCPCGMSYPFVRKDWNQANQ